MKQQHPALLSLLETQETAILDEWLAEAGSNDSNHQRATVAEARELLQLLRSALQAGGDAQGANGPAWQDLNQALESLSRSRASRGQTAGDTTVFLQAMKKPLFTLLQQKVPAAGELGQALWSATSLIDQLAQRTANTFQQAREDIIRRQQEELLELSTPVVKLWEGVLAVPMIGVLDSNRTQVVMETLLQRIVDTESELAIIDITGVPTVDTLVAQHLLKTVAAIRLMGADCIVSGIRPQIAQTIVHLGIDLQGIHTRANLADALSLALQKTGWRIARAD
ncbi:STAS domain-containing protein [Acidovorax sp. SUPP3334]|uniref:STAS domain-containing protein n=1 Tax=Acidovorax sp. SUPP3334 TaxID=2920881 RepID=UPI0023DE29B3|nr:STAS domain-containing protein [Acidovorax sp. SUPP3334]GKT21161.1 STAS domain-containing protein [Acidovorax sp. SUPP3334]